MRSVLSCQGFQIYVGETDDENASLCRHAFPDDIWVHLSERASPHAIVSIGDLKLLPSQEDRCRRSRDGRKELDLSHTIYEAALLVKFFSDAREEEDTSAVYARVDSLLSHETNKGSEGAVYDILAGCSSHYDDELADLPGRVITTRMPHFYRVEYDEHRVMQLLARSERSGTVANLDREFSAWRETMLRREAASRRDWYMRRSYGEQIFQDDSEDDSEEENEDFANIETMEQNGEHHDHDDADDMSVEQRAMGISDSDEGHICEVDEHKHLVIKLKEEINEEAQPTEKVEVQRVVEMKTDGAEHVSKDDSCTKLLSDKEGQTSSRELSYGHNAPDGIKDPKATAVNEIDDVNYLEPRGGEIESTKVVADNGVSERTVNENKNDMESSRNMNAGREKRLGANSNEECSNMARVLETKGGDNQTDKDERTGEVFEKRMLDGANNKSS